MAWSASGNAGEAGTFSGLHYGAGVGSGHFQGIPILQTADAAGDLTFFMGGSLSRDEWRLVFADEVPEFQYGFHQLFVFNGFGPISVTQSWQENVVTTTTFGPEPSVYTAPGEPRRLDVKAFFPAQHMFHDIQDVIDRLELMRTFSPALGRKPRITFDWGGLSIDYVPHKFYTGSHTGFNVSFTLLAERDLVPTLVGMGSFGETKYMTLGPYETFETAAHKVLGDPSKGPLLRLYNEHVVDDEFNTKIKVLDKGHPKNSGKPRMMSYVFAGDWEADFQTYASELEGGYGDWNSIPSEYTA